MASPFEVLVTNLNQLGFFGFLLPWLFVFAVSFGILLKTKVLGDDKKIIGVVSLTLAFFVIGFGGPAFGNFFVALSGLSGMVLAGILVIILFVSMAGGDFSKLMESKASIALVAGIGIIVFVTALGARISVSSEALAAIFMVIVLAVAVYFVAK